MRTYRYSIFSIPALILFIIFPLAIFGPMIKYGTKGYFDVFVYLFIAIYEGLKSDFENFINENGIPLLFVLVIIYAIFYGFLIYFTTKLTIDEKYIKHKQLFTLKVIENNDILGFKKESNRYYVIYSKSQKNFKISIDSSLDRKNEIINYLTSNFTKLD